MSLFINETPEEKIKRLRDNIALFEQEKFKKTFERAELVEKKFKLSDLTEGEIALANTLLKQVEELQQRIDYSKREIEEILKQISQNKSNEK